VIARLYVVLPFAFTLPEGESYRVYEYDEEGFKIQFYPPVKCDKPLPDDVENILIDGKKGVRVNCLWIDFKKDSFDRADPSSEPLKCDPSFNFINKTVNSFLSNIRFVTKAAQVQSIDFMRVNWRMDYLNDDGSELKQEKGFIRMRAAQKFTMSWSVINAKIWDDIFKLPPFYESPVWEGLLLDAGYALPHVGQSIVLVCTALEVFISTILEDLYLRSSTPKDLWAWLNKRQYLSQEPSFEDQYSILLKIVLGFSLKENDELWVAFCNIRKARNTFVHGGQALLLNKAIAKEDDVGRLITKAREIINLIRNKLPVDMQWPEYNHVVKVEATLRPLNGKF
jgi:hypothetical protein